LFSGFAFGGMGVQIPLHKAHFAELSAPYFLQPALNLTKRFALNIQKNPLNRPDQSAERPSRNPAAKP